MGGEAAATDGRRPTFKEQQFRLRETAILEAANLLLSRKGFDLMSMDDVASEVGIAKGSLYKHFASKEALAAAALVRVIRYTLDYLRSLPASATAVDRLRSVLGWTMKRRLEGTMPTLPATNTALQTALLADAEYSRHVGELNAVLMALIGEARDRGQLNGAVPAPAVLFALYARACDPALEFLKDAGFWEIDEIVDFMVSACFDGLAARA